MKVIALDFGPGDEVPVGSEIIGRAEIDAGHAVYRALLIKTPSGFKKAVYLNRLKGTFETVDYFSPEAGAQ